MSQDRSCSRMLQDLKHARSPNTHHAPHATATRSTHQQTASHTSKHMAHRNIHITHHTPLFRIGVYLSRVGCTSCIVRTWNVHVPGTETRTARSGAEPARRGGASPWGRHPGYFVPEHENVHVSGPLVCVQART